MTHNLISEKNDLYTKLNLIFNEITDFFHNLFLRGLANLQLETINSLKSFELRLIDLGADNLAHYLNNFIKKVQELHLNKSPEITLAAIDYMINILTFIRVYERVQTKNVVLNKIQQQMSSNVDINCEDQKNNKEDLDNEEEKLQENENLQ